MTFSGCLSYRLSFKVIYIKGLHITQEGGCLIVGTGRLFVLLLMFIKTLDLGKVLKLLIVRKLCAVLLRSIRNVIILILCIVNS